MPRQEILIDPSLESDAVKAFREAAPVYYRPFSIRDGRIILKPQPNGPGEAAYDALTARGFDPADDEFKWFIAALRPAIANLVPDFAEIMGKRKSAAQQASDRVVDRKK